MRGASATFATIGFASFSSAESLISTHYEPRRTLLFTSRQPVAVQSLPPLACHASAATGPPVSCKLPGFGSARRAFRTECRAKKRHTRSVDVHNLLNGKVLGDQNPAAQ